GVGHDQIEVEVDHAAEPAAGLAGTERAVEGEEIRYRVAHGEAAGRALERGREPLHPVSRVGQHRRGPSPSVPQRLLERIDQTSPLGGPEAEPVLDDGDESPGDRRCLGRVYLDRAVCAYRSHV